MGQDYLDQPIMYDENGKIMAQFDLLKKDLRYISNLDNENIKVTRWNTYYYKKYKAHNNILIFIISVCVLIFILTFFNKTTVYFDTPAYMIIVGFILAVSLLIVFYLYYDIFRRDNMNFDELDYGPGNIIKPKSGQVEKDYVDISANKCKERDPRNLANSKFLNQLFY